MKAKHTDKRLHCAITGEEIAPSEGSSLNELHPKLMKRILVDHPDLTDESLVSRREIDRYRLLYVQELLRQERGELTELDADVARSLAEGDLVSEDIEARFSEVRTLGERWSDALAEFGGSWTFLIFFGVVLILWTALNGFLGATAFDPYPFILLNLVLSCIAAVQAPIIMMSQRRQETKDRLRSINDYRVNLKAELEIRHLHEKVDHLISKQWQRLAEIQELQLELLQERP